MAGKLDVSGTLGSAAAGQSYQLVGETNIQLNGVTGSFVGTVVIEKSYDNVTFSNDTLTDLLSPAQWVSPSTVINVVAYEPASGVFYRVRVSAYTSGTLAWRMVK